MRKLILLGALAVVWVAAGATNASATTWTGHCDGEGSIAFFKPFGLIIDNNNAEFKAAGTCTGTLDGKPYNGPAQMYVDERNMNKPMSCEFGISDGDPGWIYFGNGSPNDVDATLLRFYVDETHVLASPPVHFYGAYNGEAIAQLNYHFDQSVLEACANGTLSTIEFDVHADTISQLYG
jgi:hypothetical protein